ncbi:DUF6446 family protein [Primorskyibacter sp. S187A]|uniref:DUF6446 family protein n=1 Tax=Primorskyibacter sp. S187A TaxID=3415130 RepID=UPI003C7E2C23
MMGKLMGGAIVLVALIAGGAMYYLQVYAFYEEIVPNGTDDVVLLPLDGGSAEPIAYADFTAIDSDSSPIRYRACFTTTLTPDAARKSYTPFERPVPRVAPGWFECFDAEAIAAELDAGTAQVFLAGKNVRYGVDRVVALTDDGRGYVWHELNNCGEKAYDGTVVGEDCPPLEDFQ